MPVPVIETPSLSGVESIREETRKWVAYIALVGFFVILATILVGWLTLRFPIDDVLKVLTTTASILSGVVGAVIGFYFRGSDNS